MLRPQDIGFCDMPKIVNGVYYSPIHGLPKKFDGGGNLQFDISESFIVIPGADTMGNPTKTGEIGVDSGIYEVCFKDDYSYRDMKVLYKNPNGFDVRICYVSGRIDDYMVMLLCQVSQTSYITYAYRDTDWARIFKMLSDVDISGRATPKAIFDALFLIYNDIQVQRWSQFYDHNCFVTDAEVERIRVICQSLFTNDQAYKLGLAAMMFYYYASIAEHCKYTKANPGANPFFVLFPNGTKYNMALTYVGSLHKIVFAYDVLIRNMNVDEAAERFFGAGMAKEILDYAASIRFEHHDGFLQITKVYDGIHFYDWQRFLASKFDITGKTSPPLPQTMPPLTPDVCKLHKRPESYACQMDDELDMFAEGVYEIFNEISCPMEGYVYPTCIHHWVKLFAGNNQVYPKLEVDFANFCIQYDLSYDDGFFGVNEIHYKTFDDNAGQISCTELPYDKLPEYIKQMDKLFLLIIENVK